MARENTGAPTQTPGSRGYRPPSSEKSSGNGSVPSIELGADANARQPLSLSNVRQKLELLAVPITRKTRENLANFGELTTQLDRWSRKTFEALFEQFDAWARRGDTEIGNECSLEVSFPDPSYSVALVQRLFSERGWETKVELGDPAGNTENPHYPSRLSVIYK